MKANHSLLLTPTEILTILKQHVAVPDSAQFSVGGSYIADHGMKIHFAEELAIPEAYDRGNEQERYTQLAQVLFREVAQGMGKIAAIKAYRCATGCGLKEAKDAVERGY